MSNQLEYAEDDWFDAISSPENLQDGWDKVRINAGAPGGDGLTVEQFGRNAASRLLGLSRKLRMGRYLPGPARRTYIPKKSGGERPLDIPCVEDRIIQSAVVLFLHPYLEAEFEDSSFAYRPGRGVRDAVFRVASYRRQGFRHVVDADIKRFFEKVPHDLLVLRLEETIKDQRLIDLIWMWLEWYAPSGRGLPQGSPLSPALSNLYLDRIDEQIAGRGVRLVRYADDFVLLCKGQKSANRALEHAKSLLEEFGLELNEEKTRVVDFDQGFRFLGHVFVRSLVFHDTVLDDTPNEDSLSAINELRAMDRAAEAKRLDAIDKDLAGQLSGAQPKDLSLSRQWRTLYVLEPGRTLSAQGGAFIVMEGTTRLLGLAAARVGRIETGKEVGFDTAALDLAGAEGIPLVRLDGYGAPTGKWVSTQLDHGRRHRMQFAAATEPNKALAISRVIVEARLRNQWALLKRMDARKRNPELAETAPKFRRLIRSVSHAQDSGTLLGLEGQGAAHFWRHYSAMLPERWNFPARKRKPATGIGEVALNITSALLARDIEVALRRCDLHTGIGFLHVARDDGEALVYDMMEEFRAPVAEAAVAAAIGRKQLELSMFRRSNQLGWSINRFGYKALVRAYENTANRTLRDHIDKDRTTWRGLFVRQAERLANWCEGGEPYQPYHMDY